MSTKPEPYMHEWRPGLPYEEAYTGWAYPPKNFEKWGELVYQWTAHCVERYGRPEVESWWWQTWNEANIGYWKGTPEEFQKLHDFAMAGVLRALPTARIGVQPARAIDSRIATANSGTLSNPPMI